MSTKAATAGIQFMLAALEAQPLHPRIVAAWRVVGEDACSVVHWCDSCDVRCGCDCESSRCRPVQVASKRGREKVKASELLSTIAYDYFPSFNDWLKSKGLEWPNLGVNWPAGAAIAAGDFLSMQRRRYDAEKRFHDDWLARDTQVRAALLKADV